jgi:hypothetical protein
MVGVMCVETTSWRACGLGLLAAGAAASEGSGCGVLVRSWATWDVRWPDWRRGSGMEPVERLCDTVVIRARRGRRKVGGSVERDSRSAFRAERASSAIVVSCDCGKACCWIFSWLLRERN